MKIIFLIIFHNNVAKLSVINYLNLNYAYKSLKHLLHLLMINKQTGWLVNYKYFIQRIKTKIIINYLEKKFVDKPR